MSLFAVWAAVARAQDPTGSAPQPPATGVDLAEEAEVSFELGVQFVQRGDYLTGLQHLLQSNRLAPNKNVLYNIAGAYEALGRLEQAYQYYTDYVSLETDPARRADGERGLNRLAGRVALIQVQSDPPGATVYVDRRDLGARGVTPRTIAVSPGSHNILLEDPGFAPLQQSAVASRGVTTQVSVHLDRLLGEVRVFGDPPGAELRLEGSDQVVGTVPSTIQVPVGSTVLDITAPGYAPRKAVVEVSTDAQASLDATLSLLTGRLIVDSPGHPGALVEIDGKAVAFTPQVLDVAIGQHALRVSATGYDAYTENIDVQKDAALTVDARLRGNVLDPLVVSASRTAELLSDTPVPLTVVTSDMIRAIGARTLKDVLTIYVPGMTAVEDHNELNVAMRGVYASSQQKILVMIDGHRLNSRAFSAADPDFSIMISPDRIKQIEVLRGPGSAAYGNVAYSAVVNIITKDGEEVGGFVGRGGWGNYGQGVGSIVYGSGTGPNDGLTVWGQVYRALGEPVHVDARHDYAVDSDADGVVEPHAGTALVDGVRDPASYDVGMRYEVHDFHLLGDTSYGKHTEPFTSVGVTGAVYDYDKMRKFLGIGPGLGSQFNHLELGWDPSVDRSQFDLTAYYDTNTVEGNTTSGYLTHLDLGWVEDAEGGTAQYTVGYDALGSGSLLVGGQYEIFHLRDALEIAGTDGDFQTVVDTDQREIMLPGSESTWSAFTQLKHAFVDSVILNVGARFDYKIRRPGVPRLDIPDQDNIANLSPRLALVLKPSKEFATKLSYAESFVDAPYWYRYNNLASYAGAVTLRPEHLRAAQITPDVTLFDGQFKSTTNVAWQSIYDAIYRDNNAVAPDPFYVNAGRLDSIVAEEELALVTSLFRVRANGTWQHVLDVKNYDATTDGISNVPSLVGNLVLDANPLASLDRTLWTDVTVRAIGPQAAPIRAVSEAWPNADVNAANELRGTVLFDVGARFEHLVGGLSVDGRIYNLLDTRYTQGGSTLFPYPQAGRWFLVNLEYAFDPKKGESRGRD